MGASWSGVCPDDIEYCLHVRDIDGAGELGEGEDELVVAASTFKVAVALAFFDLGASAALDPAQRLTLPPGARTDGPTGISILRDAVSVTLRDAAALMLTVSDNAATDALLARIGVDAVHDRLRELGLVDTYLEGGCMQLMDTVANDLGFHEWEELLAADRDVSADELLRSRTFDPARTTRTTAREMTGLLAAIWRDGSPACAEVRRLMELQVTRDRLAAGFPPGVRVAAKSGSWLRVVRNEVGVAEYPDGRRYAIAVFTRTSAPHSRRPDVDRAIGDAARAAVETLR
jgi:beta-lactamase class A